MSVIGCLHNPANVQQTSSIRIQNTHANAGRLLDVCWIVYTPYYCDIVTVYSGSSEDLSTACMTAPVLRPPTPSLRSPLKSTSSTVISNVKRRQRTISASYTSAGDGPVVRSGTRNIYTAGRPPWYDSQGQLKEAFVIGVYSTATIARD